MMSMGRWRWQGAAIAAAAVAAGVALHGAEAGAQERFNPRNGLVTTGGFYRFTAAARLNPIGLFLDFRGGYRRRLFNAPDRSVLLRNTYWAAAGSVVLSPAFVRPGVVAEFQPLAVLNLQVAYERIWWFLGSTWGHMQTYNSAAENWSTLSVGDAAKANAVAGTGQQVTLQGTLQARVGQTLAIRNTFRAVRQWYDTDSFPVGRPRPLYYNPFYDSIELTDGWVFVNDLDVIATLTDLGTNIGLRYSVVSPLLEGFGRSDVDTTTHRLGPIVSYTFRERRHSWLNAPTLFVLAQWWIVNQWRTGNTETNTVTQWAPMFILGFSFRGDA